VSVGNRIGPTIRRGAFDPLGLLYGFSQGKATRGDKSEKPCFDILLGRPT
jgi:hypothetical protein